MLVFFFCLSSKSYSQQNTTGFSSKIFVADNDIFGTRVFQQNSGQYGAQEKKLGKILYAYDHGGERVYFTEWGLVYELS